MSGIVRLTENNDCDIIISWNFKHLVNVKTIDGIRAITQLKRYFEEEEKKFYGSNVSNDNLVLV